MRNSWLLRTAVFGFHYLQVFPVHRNLRSVGTERMRFLKNQNHKHSEINWVVTWFALQKGLLSADERPQLFEIQYFGFESSDIAIFLVNNYFAMAQSKPYCSRGISATFCFIKASLQNLRALALQQEHGSLHGRI